MGSGDFARTLKCASAAALALDLLIFSAYFIIMDSQALILCTLPVVLLAAFLASPAGKYAPHALFLAATLIGAAAVSYSTAGAVAFLYSVLAAGALAAVLGGLSVQLKKPAYAIYPAFGAALLYAMYLLRFSSYPDFAVNVGILGYYAAIFGTISIVAGGAMRKASGRIMRLGPDGTWRYGLLLAACVAVLALPVWPTGIIQSKLPSMDIRLGSITGSGLYALSFNAPKYALYENGAVSNLRFYYGNGTSVDAYIGENSSYESKTDIVIKVLPGTQDVVLRFMPYSTGFGGQTTAMNKSDFAALENRSARISPTYGQLQQASGVRTPVRRQLRAVSQKYSLTYLNETIDSYLLMSVCPSGYKPSVRIVVHSSSPVNLFLFHNLSDFTFAIDSIYRSGGSYSSYISQLSGHSYQKFAGLRNVSARINLTDCTYYTVLPDGSADVSILQNVSYGTWSLAPVNGTGLAVLEYGQLYFGWGALPYSLGYLEKMYQESISGTLQ